VDETEPIQYKDQITGFEKTAKGTPLDGKHFELPCVVSNDQPNCAIPQFTYSWDMATNAADNEYKCGSALCFLVVTIDATDVVFTTSPALTAHMDSRALKATISPVPVMEGALHRIREYAISDIRGFPAFVNKRDLEVCYDTVPAGAGKRCLQLYFGVPPFHLRLSVDGAPFLPRNVARIMPYQKSRVVVRVRDLNTGDRVCIDYPATFNRVSNVPGNREDSAGTAFFDWEDSIGHITDEDACYHATRCVSGLVGGTLCAGGEWERIFTIKAKTSNTTVMLGSDQSSNHVKSASRWSTFADKSAESATLKLNVVLAVPAFIDDVPGANKIRGTPYAMERLDTAFINCPVPTVAVYSLLQLWTDDSDVSGSASYTYSDSEPVEIIPQGELPGGIVLSHPDDTQLQRYEDKFAGNYFMQGRIASVEIDWTPTKGQEGKDHTLCFMARGKDSGTTNLRCFVVPVARCQYCTVEGDSLQSLSVDYKTSWLQLWSANAGPLFKTDHASDYPINPAHLPPRTRLALGPLYHVKAHDSLDSLATRFRTNVEHLMDLNPDLLTDQLVVGQELCVIPNVCPEVDPTQS